MSTDVSAQDNNRHCCLADLICRFLLQRMSAKGSTGSRTTVFLISFLLELTERRYNIQGKARRQHVHNLHNATR
ncbi:hypothetical protein PVAP13_9KG262000 [Panicum virgatum]|uniref:Uncharacterized protein n=1 Tax=Panicum virgatum TaxID=38727 RepID=A0A8T0NKF9_PANVG|nr:hypothetical protein PVAP13_9KG262000 [Panicum virgatum]